MVVYLREQADLRSASLIPDWNERGAAVVETLTRHAGRSQKVLLADLRRQGYEPRSFWIVNAIAVRGESQLAEWLAEQPEVALVTKNVKHRLETLSVESSTPLTDSVAWGVIQVGAPTAWQSWGVQGEGIVVGSIDTGVALTHTALLRGYRGWSPDALSHDFNWRDFTNLPPSPAPDDEQGHGTHTMGTMVGRRAPEGRDTGIAPAARWISARACDIGLCGDTALIAAAQWMLAPTDLEGENPRPDLRPHVINNSWGSMPPDPWYTGYVEAWNAAGIFSVFSNGNNGPGCETSGSPGEYAASFSVGATDAEDEVTSYSSRGPNPDGLTKPDMTAPGAEILSTTMDGAYGLKSGSSMAAPHVAGAVALLWSANPALIGDLAATRTLLTLNALPRASDQCGDAEGAVPNNVYGWGRLDVARAVQAARVEVPWLELPRMVVLPEDGVQTIEVTLDARRVAGPGQYRARLLVSREGKFETIPVTLDVLPGAETARLRGRLVDRWTGEGVLGRVSFADGPTLVTEADGSFTATLPHGTHEIEAEASGYLPARSTVSIPRDSDHTLTLVEDSPHLELHPQPNLTIRGDLEFAEQRAITFTVSNEGSRPLEVAPTVPATEWTIEDGGAATLYDMRAFPSLPLTDSMILTDSLELGFALPIYGGLATRLYLSSDGWVSVARPEASDAWALCLPGSNLPAGTLAPFWADLDPSAGGAVRAGRVSRDTYVVSFEAVPEWRLGNPQLSGRPTYTFQLALHADGWIEFLYGSMGPMPRKWSVGVSTSFERGQGIACNREPKALSGRSWRFLNQPNSELWAGVEPSQLTVAPGEAAEITVMLKGTVPVPWRREFDAAVQLATNDPRQRVVTIPVAVTIGEAPFQLGLPLLFIADDEE
jgi:subtilisin family serine protease